ncbi:CGNR zinc finger domain-containing protein [Embleya sp. NPDC127516]|uniref:CGNR zinc finger domain-containing protein n=1 Tax=Embleya sp. NPDC127516 TaxID=3363990 RepID=UPI00381A747A
MDIRPLTGEPLALDLANTHWPLHGARHDHLDDSALLRAWLAEHALDELLDTTPETVLDAVRDALVATREAIRAALEEGAYQDLDAVLARGTIRLGLGAQGPTEQVDVTDPAWRPAWEAARAYLELLRTTDPERIRRCANPECTLWFADVSKNGRRRWCSMAECGNRAKTRAHYARSR